MGAAVPNEAGRYLRRLAVSDGVALEGQDQGRVARRELGRGASSAFGAAPRDGTASVRDQIANVFVDPSGTHGIVAVADATFYVAMHAPVLKTRGPVAGLRDASVTSVAWFRPASYAPDNDDWNALVATAGGTIYECLVSSRAGISDVSPVVSLPDGAAITGLAVARDATNAGGRVRVAVATAKGSFRLTREAVASPAEALRAGAAMVVAGDLEAPPCRSYVGGQAVLIDTSTASSDADAWFLTSVGLVRVSGGAAAASASGRVAKSLVRLPEHAEPTGSMAQTELHVLVLCTSARSSVSAGATTAMGANHWVVGVSKITGTVAFESSKFDVLESPPIALTRDDAANAVWVYSARGVALVDVRNERVGAVRLMLSRALQTRTDRDFERALALAATREERDLVLTTHAEDAFARGKHVVAARLWAAVSSGGAASSSSSSSSSSTSPGLASRFEQIALRLASAARAPVDGGGGDHDADRAGALRTFLRLKLEQLVAAPAPAAPTATPTPTPPRPSASTTPKTPKTILSVWLVQVFLDDMMASEDPTNGVTATTTSTDKSDALVVEFWEFLHTFRECLEPAKETVFHLLSSSGRVDLVLFYANLTHDYDRIVTHHVHRGAPMEAVRTLEELVRRVKDAAESDPATAALTARVQELAYRHASVLFPAAPDAMTRVLVDAPFLDPVRLIPALASSHVSDAAIRYLEHCVSAWGVRDEAVHNFLLSAYVDAATTDANAVTRERVTKYVRTQTTQAGGTCFDAGFALRLCNAHADVVEPAARVLLFDAVGMPDDAVTTALEAGLVNAAERIAAERASNDGQETGKRLWLLVAREACASGGVARALETLRKAGGALSVEDLLPILPDLASVDDVREHVCAALEARTAAIERLKSEIDEFAQSAEALKREALEERLRFDSVPRSKRCDLCLVSPASSRDFFVFPCTHAVHADCLTEEILSRVAPDKRHRLDALRRSRSDADHALLDEILSASCPLCGEMMVQQVAEPLVLADDDAEARLWD